MSKTDKKVEEIIEKCMAHTIRNFMDYETNVVRDGIRDDAVEAINTEVQKAVEEAVMGFYEKLLNAFENGFMEYKENDTDDLVSEVLNVTVPQIIKGIYKDYAEKK